MAEQVHVHVYNDLTDHTIGAIRYNIVDGQSHPEPEVPITIGDKETVLLVREQTSLTIKLPNGVFTADCLFRVEEEKEEMLLWSTMDDHWTIEINLNQLPSNVPTTVNVNVGDPGSG